MDRRPWVMFGAFVAVLAATLAVAIALPVAQQSRQPTIIPGVATATDGRLAITIDSWLVANNNYTEFPGNGYPDNEYFLVVNLTIANLGNGNASVPSGFVSATVSEAGMNVSNSWFRAHSNRSGEVTLPNNLFPGSTESGWWAFYMPGAGPSASLLLLDYWETYYGGTYLGDGGYGPPLGSTLNIEFEIQPPS